MLKFLLIFISQAFFISSNPVVQPSSKSLTSSSTFENIAFLKLGTYRGFTDDGAEYQKTYFLSRFPSTSFAESRSFCNSYKMDLITIETGAESREFLNILDAHSYLRTITAIQLWVDALTVTIKSKTEWFWTNIGNKVSFPIAWLETEPNDMGGSEYCLFIGKLSLNAKFGYGDGNCLTNSRYAICQNIDLIIP